MNLKNLPEINTNVLPDGVQWDIPESVIAKWQPEIEAVEKDDGPSISIYGYVGGTPDGNGMTDRKVSGILRSLGGKDVTVYINSPGGNFFQGAAIYNLLRQHKGSVRTRIVGMAASAASVVAMAGDEIEIADAAFMFIHNSQAMAAGDRNVMMEMAESMALFDNAMAKVYSARAGKSAKAFSEMMDKETMFDSSKAIDAGLADSLLAAEKVRHGEPVQSSQNALRVIRASLIAKGYGRRQSDEIINSFKSHILAVREDGESVTLDAGEDAMRDADMHVLNNLKSIFPH